MHDNVLDVQEEQEDERGSVTEIAGHLLIGLSEDWWPVPMGSAEVLRLSAHLNVTVGPPAGGDHGSILYFDQQS